MLVTDTVLLEKRDEILCLTGLCMVNVLQIRKLPNRRIFTDIYQRLLNTGSPQPCCKIKYDVDNIQMIEEEILNTFEEDPTRSIKCVALEIKVSLPCSCAFC